ncbi:MBOAT family O-acyltransferase [Polaribacter aquimarinus]|uniref:Membrane-bound O-acyltransferase family protein n=1 Tax=Polaribacter aquimarinus TaxID=2100726 RepID=A0A2U2J7L0_9FLAO|nr:MBOAT family O-acyltransferase [Polaribacter aquimarinus]PWG04292.1 membrane-bound O-acyltransferase family protein [Polaribacter aquimarinus]
MLFNSIDFAIFLPIVFILYWFVFSKKVQQQNVLILVSSYVFYGFWDWRFLLLIFFSSSVDFIVGIKLKKASKTINRKLLLFVSIFINIGLLGFFKYFNFFLENFANSFSFFGDNFSVNRLNIILPVGISFYTFQTLSYSIDIYRKKLDPTENFIEFLSFVSFFPQLVAGPIERASNLLPQFYKRRIFDYDKSVSGVRLIIWGFFKKVVIADNASIIVNGIFNNFENQSFESLLIGAFLFSFQIYGDFSGYSDIAIGTARLFNFDLKTNFRYPYLSINISEFWKRWHISLSTWFRDYLYFPLGGSKYGLKKTIRNIFIVFLVSGFWHGANWTFIFWGFIHSILYIPLFILNTKTKKQAIGIKKVNILIKTILTFLMVMFSWIVFRSDTISNSLIYIQRILTLEEGLNFFVQTDKYMVITLICFISIIFSMIIELYNEKKNRVEVYFNSYFLIFLCLIITFFGAIKNHADFIYFQF